MSGFTYNGVHCSARGVDYAPGPDDRWFNDAEFETYDTEVSWRHGGYHYGSKAKIRTFVLKCYFEEITIAQREAIRRWLARDTHGQLIFDDKPFVYWNVYPSKIVPGQIYNDLGKYSGTFQITFAAPDPFGYLTRKSNAGNENDNASDYCGIKATSQMPAAPTTSSRTFTVYNPGNESCGMTIRVAGSASHPIMFMNNNTGNKTQCVIGSLPTNNLILDIDGDTGYAMVKATMAATSGSNGLAYHDRGIVRLDPGNNTINILEQTANGGWSSTTTLALSAIAVDYRPRIL